MKNERLFINKKKRTKWWISLAVVFTSLVGASLGALSMYNWSFNQAIQGLFYSNDLSEVADDSEKRVMEEREKERLNPPKDNEKEPMPSENTDAETPDPSEDELDDVTPPTQEEAPKTPETITEPTFVKGVLIANKQHPLPATYAPGENEEAKEAFFAMRTAGDTEGFDLVAFSTYRSYDYQDELYHRYVDQHSQAEADRFSARPGYSEHQTGLGFDIGEVGQEIHWASDSFKDTAAAKWLSENAHNFGFILRYPEGKEHITGYQYESWHFRYLGVELATKVYNSGITLEEYLNI